MTLSCLNTALYCRFHAKYAVDFLSTELLCPNLQFWQGYSALIVVVVGRCRRCTPSNSDQSLRADQASSLERLWLDEAAIPDMDVGMESMAVDSMLHMAAQTVVVGRA